MLPHCNMKQISVILLAAHCPAVVYCRSRKLFDTFCSALIYGFRIGW